MAQVNKGQKYDIDQFMKFISGDRIKSDVLKSKHFNVVVICLDDGYELPPHHEPYDVLFYVISGKGIITAGDEQWKTQPGSMVFAPVGVRGIKCFERMTVL